MDFTNWGYSRPSGYSDEASARFSAMGICASGGNNRAPAPGPRVVVAGARNVAVQQAGGQQQVVGGQAEVEGEWNCATCTYRNHQDAGACMMCGGSVRAEVPRRRSSLGRVHVVAPYGAGGGVEDISIGLIDWRQDSFVIRRANSHMAQRHVTAEDLTAANFAASVSRSRFTRRIGT